MEELTDEEALDLGICLLTRYFDGVHLWAPDEIVTAVVFVNNERDANLSEALSNFFDEWEERDGLG